MVYSIGLNIYIFYSFHVLLMLVLMLGQRCSRRNSNKPAITARAVSVSSRTNGTGPTLAASERDIETSNAITVWLRSANVSPVLTALSQHWRNAGVDGPTLPSLSLTNRVGE